MVYGGGAVEAFRRSRRRSRRAKETSDHRFLAGAEAFDQLLNHLGSRRLGDDGDNLGLRILLEGGQGGESGEPADKVRGIIPAGAYGVGDAQARIVDLTGELLQPGARSGHYANASLAHDIGESKADPVDEGCAAAWPH